MTESTENAVTVSALTEDSNYTELWTEKEVSDQYRIPLGTLRYWRHKKAVLPFRKLGNLVRYVPEEVQAAIDAAKVDVSG